MICKICNIEKSDDEFYKRYNFCKKCYCDKYKKTMKRFNKKYQKTEKRQQYNKKYYQEKKEHLKTNYNKNKHQNYKYKMCIECKLFIVSRKPFLCSRCNPNAKQSKGELQIQKLLQENNIQFIKQYKFKNQSKEIIKCRYDFFIPSLNTIIEFNGIQHYKFSQFFHKTNYNYLKYWYRDILKKEFCLENNINFIEIKYNENILTKLQIENVI